MRDIFTEIFENQPIDPTELARSSLRHRLRKRFYERATVGEGGEVLLDGKQVFTPARKPLTAPSRALARSDRRGMECANRRRSIRRGCR